MKAISGNSRNVLRFCSADLSPPFRCHLFNTDSGGSNNKNNGSFESSDDFERHLFGDIGNSPDSNPFFRKLDKIEKAHGRFANSLSENDGGSSQFMDGQIQGFDTLTDDGIDSKLKKKANYFAFTEEIKDDDYSFRPDVTFWTGATYTPRDLDLTKPGIQKNSKKIEFETTTKEVLKKADFRNVRFLARFLTEAGIIIKRSQTKISAKAQRKVAREIKTARALGLMPFTTMGTKPFIFGKSMKEDPEEYENDMGMPIP